MKSISVKTLGFKNLFFVAVAVSVLLGVSSVSSAQYYDNRPSILDVTAKENENSKKLPNEWLKASAGHFTFLAQIMTFFPDSDYYFLARDIEYVYDIAQLQFKNDATMRKRLHLVPISTYLSHNSTGTVEYLEQEGLTKEKLNGRSAVFIDSCCTGSVPNRIKAAFKDRKKGVDIKGFLIQTTEYPNSKLASLIGADGEEIESLPHHTNSATQYVTQDGKIRIEAALAGRLEREKVRAMMQQIRHDFDSTETRKEFKDLLKTMRVVFAYVVPDSSYGRVSEKAAKAALEHLARHFELPVRTFIQDIMTLKRKSGYGTIDQARAKKLIETSKFAQELEIEALALRYLVGPEALASHNKIMEDQRNVITERVLRFYLEGDYKDFGVSKQTFEAGRLAWIDRLEAEGAYDLENFSDIGVPLRFLAKFKSADAALQIFIRYSSLNTVAGKHHEIRKLAFDLVAEALSAEGFKVGKNSTIGKILDSGSLLENHPEILSVVVATFAKEASSVELEKLLIQLLDVSDKLIDHYSDSSINKELIKAIRAAFEALPKIRRPVLLAYLKSRAFSMVFESSRFGHLARVLLVESKRFEADALTLQLSSDAAEKVTKGALKAEKNQIRVSALSQVLQQAQAAKEHKKALKCEILFEK